MTVRRPLVVEKLSIRGFRNLATLDLEFGERFNVVFGDNGQGKTNLLEALYVVLTSRSFRAGKPIELVTHGEEVASVRAIVREDGATREQSVGLKAGVRVARIDGKRTATLAAFATASPVVVFHPGLVALSMGGGGERRKLLDRVALYALPTSLAALDNYGRAVRARQRSLEHRGLEARDIEDWESLVVRHGTEIMRARMTAAERLGAAACEAFVRIAPGVPPLGARYYATAPLEESSYRAELRARRMADARRGSASIGPHKDDFILTMGDRPVRGVASQGQHRAVVLALKLAEIEVLEQTRGSRPILLLDDVSSELDRTRTSALFRALHAYDGQVVLTTTRPELIELRDLNGDDSRRDFRVESGQVSAASSAPHVA